jgi:hypothetical protein
MNMNKKENLLALMLFVSVMLLKICSIVALCSKYHEHYETAHTLHPPTIKKTQN